MSGGSDSIAQRLDRAVAYGIARLRGGGSVRQAGLYYGGFHRYHVTNDDSEHAWVRSRWVAATAVPAVCARSVLELGCSTGRTLALLRESDPTMRLRGVDVNRHAIAAARRMHPGIQFDVADVTGWTPGADQWDAVLCMSVLNWIPDGGAERVADAIAASATAVIAIELWDGEPGDRGVYTYSRDTRALFERRGFTTRLWELGPGQYDVTNRPLWAYVGVRRV